MMFIESEENKMSYGIYTQEGIKKGLIHITEDENVITYIHHNITRNYKNPEEKVQAEIFCKLVLWYKYPVEKIGLYVPVTDGSTKKQADIFVYNDSNHTSPLIVIECKKEDVSEQEFAQATNQAFSYAHFTAGTIKYVWTTSGIKNAYFKFDKESSVRETVSDIPQHGVKKLSSYKYAYNGGSTASGQQLFPLAKVTESELTNIFKQAHQALWGGGELNPSEAFDELDKLIFCKIFDEKKDRDVGEPYDFQVIPVEPENNTEEAKAKKIDGNNTTIFYCTPKPQYSLQDTKKFSIDPTDICRIPSDLVCDDRIWKIAMWGSPRDLELIDRLQSTYPSLDQFLLNHNMKSAEGFKRGNRKLIYDGFANLPIVDAKDFYPFYIQEEMLLSNEDNTYERISNNNLAIFKAPHLIMKQSHRKGRFFASVLDYDAIFNHSLLGISGDERILKYLCLIINSKVFSYYHLLTSRTWMVERDALEAGDIRTIPIPEPSEEMLGKAVELYEHIKISGDESLLDAFVFDAYRLKDYETYLVTDALDYIYNYFDKKSNSIAFKKPSIEVYRKYYSTFMDVLKNSLGQSFTPKASFYIGESPLSVLVLSISENNNGNLMFFDNNKSTEQCLSQLDSLLTEERYNIYIRRNVRVYGKDSIYIVKPKQQKYWNYSSACRDADELFSDIMKAKG